GAGFAFQAPFVAFVIESHCGHELPLAILMNLPTTHVMTAGDDAGLDSFRDPGAHDEVSNLSFYSNQITGSQAQPGRVTGVQPQRVRVRDFVQPLRVRAARVNLNWQTKS